MNERPERTVTLLIPIPDARPAVRSQPRTAPTERPTNRTAAPARTIDVPLAPARTIPEPYIETDEPTIDWQPVERQTPAPASPVRRTKHLTVIAVTVPAVGAAGILCGLMSTIAPMLLVAGTAVAALVLAKLAAAARALAEKIARGGKQA